jgi:hypothetical protein
MQRPISKPGRARIMRIKFIPFLGVAILFQSITNLVAQEISFSALLDEMTNLKRLAELPDQSYRTIQFSSYDRRSVNPSLPGWFANEDGFGNEPIPGFEQVLKEPDANGIGEYLICDVKEPAVLVRLWTAGFTGRIRFYLDDISTPVYEGDADAFFRNPLGELSAGHFAKDYFSAFREYDAVYIPIPFSKRCRMEWIGNCKDLHFYHVEFRVYNSDIRIRTFNPADLTDCNKKLEKLKGELTVAKPGDESTKEEQLSVNANLAPDSTVELFRTSGSKSINSLALRLAGCNEENTLRKCILTIYFDQSSIPQVQVPLGDFFGAAPGINPYESLPFSVLPDSTMICRFTMPFKNSARIVLENKSAKPVHIFGTIQTSKYLWSEKISMYFHASWRMSHELIASDIDITDLPYLLVIGKGRMVGAAAYIYNPSNVPSSWGDWWGEGDEKIYVDRDSFPSFFGTGSEDYFNYSWSSASVFSFPYCGQPRNDGPGNRGYVSNFRWHIFDDILFTDHLAFYMELRHHGIVPGFNYGRIVYYYAQAGVLDDGTKITMDDIRDLNYSNWSPVAYAGSEGYEFIQAEDLKVKGENFSKETGQLWSEGKILMWKPVKNSDELKLELEVPADEKKMSLGFTFSRMPEGGKISVFINGDLVKFNNQEIIDLSEKYSTVLDNYFSPRLALRKGKNAIVLKCMPGGQMKKVGIDFLWLKKSEIN